jgi:hypothetical protein
MNFVIIILLFLLLYILIPTKYIIFLSLLSLYVIYINQVKRKIHKVHQEEEDTVAYEEKDTEEEVACDEVIEVNYEILNITDKIAKMFNLKQNRKHIYITLDRYLKSLNLDESLYVVFAYCEKIDIIKRMNIGTYIIWNTHNQTYIDYVYDKIVKISSDRLKYNTKIRSNAIDILMRSNNKKYIDTSKELLEQLKREERVFTTNTDVNEIRNVIEDLKKHIVDNDDDDNNAGLQEVLYEQIRELETRQRNILNNHNRKNTVYTDTQNVHNNMINESVINISKKIHDNPSIISRLINIELEIQENYKDYEVNKEKILSSLERINNDSAVFKDGITINEIFNKITNYISNSSYRKELIQRLAEELVDMNGLCSTGHLSRLINVIQGFPDTPEDLKIKINPKDEIYASIQSYLNSEIQKSENSEQLLDYMVDENQENKNKYLKFIIDKMKIKKVLLEKEYFNIIDKPTLCENIKEALKNYTMNENEANVILDNCS